MNSIIINGERKTKLMFDLDLLKNELSLKVDCKELKSYELTDFCLYVLDYFEKLTDSKNETKN